MGPDSRALSLVEAPGFLRALLRSVNGIPAFHPHWLRHTLACLTADTLGHRRIASVSGYT
jgi:hypothetical protein